MRIIYCSDVVRNRWGAPFSRWGRRRGHWVKEVADDRNGPWRPAPVKVPKARLWKWGAAIVGGQDRAVVGRY